VELLGWEDDTAGFAGDFLPQKLGIWGIYKVWVFEMIWDHDHYLGLKLYFSGIYYIIQLWGIYLTSIWNDLTNIFTKQFFVFPQLIPCNSFPKPGFLRRVFHIKGIGSSVNPPKLYNLMKYVYFLGDSLDKSTGTHRRQHLALIFGVNSRARNVCFFRQQTLIFKPQFGFNVRDTEASPPTILPVRPEGQSINLIISWSSIGPRVSHSL
jgi:hypothetical protein